MTGSASTGARGAGVVDDQARARLARRYPRPRTPRGVTLGLVAAGTAGALGFVVWAGVHHATPDVQGRLNTWVITSDRGADFTLTVDRTDPARPATCRVIAQADNFERVGELAVEVPPGDGRLTDIAGTVRTFRRATSISLDGCRTGG